MRYLPLAALAALLVGCSSSSSSGDDASVKPGSGVAINPSGKPQNADEAARATAMQQQGDKMNSMRAEAASAEAAAKAKTGGK